MFSERSLFDMFTSSKLSTSRWRKWTAFFKQTWVEHFYIRSLDDAVVEFFSSIGLALRETAPRHRRCNCWRTCRHNKWNHPICVAAASWVQLWRVMNGLLGFFNTGWDGGHTPAIYIQTFNIWHDQEWFPLILICADYTKYFAILNSKLEYEGKVDNHWSLTRFQSQLFWNSPFAFSMFYHPFPLLSFLWFPVGVAQSQLQRYNRSVSCG